MPEAPRTSPPQEFEESYRSGRLAPFFSLSPGDLETALATPRPTDRAALHAALERYHARLGAPPEAMAALERLAHPDSRAVVTGQQAGLLLGPVFTLSKAVTALRLAEQLTTAEKPVTAVFWVASQDHDTAEIDHAYLLDRREHLTKVTLGLPPNRASGRIPIPAEALETLLKQLDPLDVPAEHRAVVTAWLRQGMEGADNVAEAFARLLLALLGPYGLVLFDPLAPELAPLFTPILTAELAAPLESGQAITRAGEALSHLGFAPQLGRAEGATNLFVEEGGKRHLLRYQDGSFYGAAQRYHPEDLTASLRNEPGTITPAAGLRPITQDAVLPTAVMVVGPGELRYFAQLRGVYEAHGVPMPLVWPRTSATVLEPPVRRILEKFGLTPDALLGEWEATKTEVLLGLHGHARHFEEALSRLAAEISTLQASVQGIDPTLQGTVQRADRHFRQTLDILRRKSGRALGDRKDTYSRQLERLERHLLPLGQPQERVLSPVSFFLKFGIAPVLEAFLALPPEGRHLVSL